MLTCKQFLEELSDYLDERISGEERRTLEQHINACPNCWVICDTTKKTVQVFKGKEPQALPPDVHARLIAALEKKYRK